MIEENWSLSTGSRLAVAMSGGVDSSSVAAMALEAGYEVVGITMLLMGEAQTSKAVIDAARVASSLGIQHEVLDCRADFKRFVMDAFVSSYLSGQTPIPCCVCNKHIKFGAMLDFAKSLNAQALATGHYARRVIGGQGVELRKADDPARDQSYFLFDLSREQLDYVRFPLASWRKPDVRAWAAKKGIVVSEKPDSQDICFLPNGGYAAFVKEAAPTEVREGDIVDLEGHVLARHKGIVHYTIGQRKGLNISDRVGDSNDPLFVIRLDAKGNKVVVGPRSALAQSVVHLRNVNWIAEPIPDGGLDVSVRLRSAQKMLPARFQMNGGEGTITLAAPTYGVAPGQAGVIYDGARVLGGGWIV